MTVGRFMNSKRILVVDDDAVTLRYFSHSLTSRGYEVLTAVDGAGAVSIARLERPDLIVLDITFPPDVAHGGGVAWDGFLIMDWLRRMTEAKDIPIIVMTGSPAPEYEQQALAKGAAAFFRKPMDEGELLAAIRKALGQAAPGEAVPPAAGAT